MLTSVSNYENSYTYKLINDIQEITQPLRKIGVQYFLYMRLTASHYVTSLVDNDKMAREFINSVGLKYEIALSPHKLISSGLYFISPVNKPKEIMNFYEKFFNFNQVSYEVVYIIDKQDSDIRDVYIFGINNSNYINHNYLELFMLYFQDRISNFRHVSVKLKIPKEFIEYRPTISDTKNMALSNLELEQEFLDSINAQYYKLKNIQEQFSLSNRETQCLRLLLQNKITKEIAWSLNLTNRTTEVYINNLKNKLKVRTKQELFLKILVRNQGYQNIV